MTSNGHEDGGVVLDQLLNDHFPGKIVRKDLTKMVKEGANVPIFVLEYLLGNYCASTDPAIVDQGMQTVKKILSENFVRPDEAEKVKSLIREKGSYKVIDKVSVVLNESRDVYEAQLFSLGIKGVEVPTQFIKEYEKLLVGGIWALVTLEHFFEEGQRGSPFTVRQIKPIQMPNMDVKALQDARKHFTADQWHDVLLRSTGMEPTNLDERMKWHLLARMIPFVENNYNLCELGPRGTGKSHIYKEISPNSILVSGGQTSVANLFYNINRNKVGLVGVWDVVAFDEVAGIKFKDHDGVQIMKDYMASGSFVRGRESINASASMVFVGNIDNVKSLLKTSHLLSPFPEAMIDSAFFDRFHAYVPGWEIPKMKPDFFTNQYGFIVDYLAEFFREIRKFNFGDAIGKYFKLGKDLNQRDTIAVKRTTSGLLKLLYPHEQFGKEEVRECLEYALEARRRMKEQLKRIGGMEFFDVQLSYIDLDSQEERVVRMPEQGGDSLIPEDALDPGTLHAIGRGNGGQLGLYRLETQMTAGNGNLKISGLGSNTAAKEKIKIGYEYFRANATQIQSSLRVSDHDYHLHVVDVQNTGISEDFTMGAFVALCSALLGKALEPQLIVLGSMSLGGIVNPVDNVAERLQVASESGAKRLLLPMASTGDITTVPGELFVRFQSNWYADPKDAVFKAMGVV